MTIGILDLIIMGAVMLLMYGIPLYIAITLALRFPTILLGRLQRYGWPVRLALAVLVFAPVLIFGLFGIVIGAFLSVFLRWALHRLMAAGPWVSIDVSRPVLQSDRPDQAEGRQALVAWIGILEESQWPLPRVSVRDETGVRSVGIKSLVEIESFTRMGYRAERVTATSRNGKDPLLLEMYDAGSIAWVRLPAPMAADYAAMLDVAGVPHQIDLDSMAGDSVGV